MESIGAMLGGEWSSLSGSMYTTEEADIMAQLLGNCPHPAQVDSVSNLGELSSFWPSLESLMTLDGVNEGSFYSLDIANNAPDSYHFSQGNGSYCGGGSVVFPSSSQESYSLSDSHAISLTSNGYLSMNYYIGDGTNTESFLVDGDDCSNHEGGGNANVENSGGSLDEAALADRSWDLQRKKQAEMPAPEPSEGYKSNQPSENSKKRSQSLDDAPNKQRNVRLKRSQKLVPPAKSDEESNAGFEAPASSSCCSEDDSNTSQVVNGGARSRSSSKGTPSLDSVGKTRASKGAATDPQSLYARKRRERINERLRILQNLVPNGTKVDISTMLEEAVEYVKFLQLQIKLLSSDDMWMYAPIAYNGMNLGLDLKVPTPRS